MTAIQLIGVLWFASAVFIAVIQNVVFMLWLKKNGVSLTFAHCGDPFYLDFAYSNWCKDQGSSPRRILRLRTACLVNVILASIIAIPIIISAHAK